MTELLLVRHGQTQWSLSGQHTGRTDLELTDHGRVEAEAASGLVGRFLDGGPRPVVYSSPLKRASTTADIIAPDASIELRDELMEMDYGDFEGLTRAQIHQQTTGWDMWRDGCPNGETVEQVAARADHFIASVEDQELPVLVVAHGHLLRVLAVRAIGLGATHGSALALDTATLSVIGDLRGKRVMKLWNMPATLA